MEYSIHGPFRIHRRKGLVDTTKPALDSFWEEVEEDSAGLSQACGCYVFAIRAAKGVRPWYVGLAEKQTFEHECFALHKEKIYNLSLAQRKGTPLLYLAARRTDGAKFSKPSSNGHRSARYLEIMLIAKALERNSDLMNIRDTTLLREMVVPTILNTPQRPPRNSEKEFRLMME